MSYKDPGREPVPMLGGLGSIYENFGALHWPLIRATAGIILFTHGWPKLMAGAQAVAANTLAKRGIEPALFLAYVLILLETAGAICITIGFLTRPIAIALVIELPSSSITTSRTGTAGSAEDMSTPCFGA